MKNTPCPSEKYSTPSNVKRREIYHEGWIDFNKNGVMDPYENPKLPIEERVEDLLSRMTLEEKIAQLQGENSPATVRDLYTQVRNGEPDMRSSPPSPEGGG